MVCGLSRNQSPVALPPHLGMQMTLAIWICKARRSLSPERIAAWQYGPLRTYQLRHALCGAHCTGNRNPKEAENHNSLREPCRQSSTRITWSRAAHTFSRASNFGVCRLAPGNHRRHRLLSRSGCIRGLLLDNLSVNTETRTVSCCNLSTDTSNARLLSSSPRLRWNRQQLHLFG